jgi:hypothetical protein
MGDAPNWYQQSRQGLPLVAKVYSTLGDARVEILISPLCPTEALRRRKTRRRLPQHITLVPNLPSLPIVTLLLSQQRTQRRIIKTMAI